MTNKFNTILENIGLCLSEKINIPQNKTFHRYLAHNHNINNIYFQNITEQQTISIIDTLPPKSSFGLIY